MATYSGYERFLPAGNVPLSAKRAKGGGLKFTITTGYVPTLGFRESDFKPSHSAMKGTLQNYGDILDEQGNIKQARIPGTVAWFEYSTALKGVRGLIKAHVPNGEEQLAQMSQTFYERYSKPNQKLISQESVQKLIPKMFKEPKSKAKDTQQMNLYGIPESDLISERDADILYEDTKAIDYYMRDKGGNIYRFDMSTENIDALFEKEMGAPLAGAGGQVINEQGMLMDDAQQQLLDYFQRLHDTKWNPGIVELAENKFTTLPSILIMNSIELALAWYIPIVEVLVRASPIILFINAAILNRSKSFDGLNLLSP